MAEAQREGAAGRMRVAVTGASGLIGSALTESLQRDGHEVVRLVRRPARGAGEVEWNPAEERIDTPRLEGVDAVVHLAGESVGERWSDEKKRRIRRSRVQGTRLLAEALASLERRPAVLVSASAIGYYGDRGEQRLDEESTPGADFLSGVAVEWEGAAEAAAQAGIRVVHPRLGVVLSTRGGALDRMLTPFRLGMGGTLGSGEQWMSWIALPDAVAALRFLIDGSLLSGPVNLVAPDPVTNAEFTRALGDALGRPAVVRVPELALRLAFGEMADAALLASQRVAPARLEEAGFRWRFPELEDALRALLAESL